MLYNFIERLQDWGMSISWVRLFEYISFRSTLAVILALIITIAFGQQVINLLKRHQIGDDVRDLGLDGQLKKKGTPTMGGLIIILAIVVPTLLFGQLDNIYIILMLITTIWLGAVGFIDDYIKVFLKNKDGLSGRFKIIGQVVLGLIVAMTMWYSPDIVVREELPEGLVLIESDGGVISSADMKSSHTTVPFFKDNMLDYGALTGDRDLLTLILYIIVATFVVTAVSNGANLTDGLDGLVTGVSAPIVAVLGILAYLSGNIMHADYLNILYIPNSGELLVFAAAMLGALIGFLWYNSFPAQVFMGDTGSLAIGGIIAVFALCIRVELLLPLLCGVFLVEALSVMVQVGYFKHTKRKYGEGRRVLLMAPIHHHYQSKGIFETKIVIRMCILSILLAALAIATLKLR